MQADNANHNLPWSQREMDDFEAFDLNGTQLEGKHCVISSFASGVLKSGKV
jgi:hypothetical protein